MTDQKKLEVIEEAFNYYHDRTSLTRLEEKELTDFVDELKEAISVTRCCETLKDEGQATLTEYATELINMQENPQDSNKEWKIVVIQNTIGKLCETLQTL